MASGTAGIIPVNVAVTGGGASASYVSGADQALTVNSNPIFGYGGSITSTPTQSASASPGQSSTGIPISPYPAGAGLATLGTTYPGSAAATGTPISSLLSSPYALLAIGALFLVMLIPPGKKGRR